jgi:hypothetical protein
MKYVEHKSQSGVGKGLVSPVLLSLNLSYKKAISYAMQRINHQERYIEGMWGFGIYLMHLSDYLAGRKHKKKARTCDVCGQQFRMIEEMEVHRRKEHPDAHPRKEESPEA